MTSKFKTEFEQTDQWFDENSPVIIVSSVKDIREDILAAVAMSKLRCPDKDMVLSVAIDNTKTAMNTANVLIGVDNNTVIDMPNKLQLPNEVGTDKNIWRIRNATFKMRCAGIWWTNFGHALIKKIAHGSGLAHVISDISQWQRVNDFMINYVMKLDYNADYGMFTYSACDYHWDNLVDVKYRGTIIKELTTIYETAIRMEIIRSIVMTYDCIANKPS